MEILDPLEYGKSVMSTLNPVTPVRLLVQSTILCLKRANIIRKDRH